MADIPTPGSDLEMTDNGSLLAIWRDRLKTFIYQYVAPFVLAIVIGGVVIGAAGYSPIESYKVMVEGSLSMDRFPVTLLMATPLIFTGLAIVVAFKANIFNVGGEGQLVLGGFAGAWVGFAFVGLPSILHIPLALLGGALAGALAGFIPGLLKVRMGAHEVITTIMLNYIFSLFTRYLVLFPFSVHKAMPQTKMVEDSARLPRLFESSQVTAALLVAILVAILTYILMQKTSLGYEIRAVGHNPTASRQKGVRVERIMILAICLSGAIAGLGGAGETLGLYGRYIQDFSPGYGFDGIAVALVAGLNPIAVIPSAVLFGALRSGGTYMDQFTDIPAEFVIIIQSLVILFMVAPQLIMQVQNIFRKKTRLRPDPAMGCSTVESVQVHTIDSREIKNNDGHS
ncbi:MAG: ABC transporter permease [Anaerolineales bacterium]|nr:ABC transporter permease [Anaerolineales bacterium]